MKRWVIVAASVTGWLTGGAFAQTSIQTSTTSGNVTTTVQTSVSQFQSLLGLTPGTAAGNIPLIQSNGALLCSLFPLGSGLSCSGSGVSATLSAAGATAATSTTAGTVPNLGGNSGAAATDSTGHLIAGEIPTSVLTTALEGAASGLATLDSGSHLAAAQLPTSVLTTASEGTAAGNLALLGTGGVFGCGLLPIDGSTVTCSSGKLVSTVSGSPSTFNGGTISGATTVANNLLVQGGSASTTYSLQALMPSANPYASAIGVFRTNASGNNPGGSAAYIRDENQSSSFTQYCCGINNGNSALQIDRILDAGSNGSQIGTTVNLTVAASNPFADEDVGYNIQGNKVGNATDSLWGISGEINDQTGQPPQSFSALGYEFDIAANGADKAGSNFNPAMANRFGYYFAPKVYWGSSSQGGLNPGFTWAASTAVTAVVGNNNATTTVQTDTSGTSRIYKVTTSGTTGTSAPTWPVSGTVTDGSAVWTEEETTAVEVGTGIFLDNGESALTSYGTGLGTNGFYQSAVIDTSLATLNSAAAALRIAAGQPIDLTGNGTAAGQNQHTLAYSSGDAALEYKTPNGMALKINDAGVPTFLGGIPCSNLPIDGSTVSCSSGKLVASGSSSGGAASSSSTVTATGATTARSLAAEAADVENVANFGAVGDMGAISAGAYSITAGAATVTGPTGAFQPSMVGKLLVLPGAGVSGAALVATISSYTDGQHVVLATNAGTTLSAVNEGPEVGTDNTSAIQAAINAAEARVSYFGGSLYCFGTVYVPDGNYAIRSLNLTGFSGSSGFSAEGLRVTGNGKLWGVGAGQVMVDALGMAWMRWDNVGFLGDAYATPKIGLQIGRTGPTAGTNSSSADNMVFSHFLMSGNYTLATLLDEQTETSEFDHVHFYNSAPGDNVTKGFTFVADGYNHFAATSAFVTNYEPTDTAQSFNELTFMNCIWGGYSPIWMGQTGRLRIVDSYLANSGPYGVILYGESGGDNIQADIDMHFETVGNALQDAFWITGPNPGPFFEGFKWKENGSLATAHMFGDDTTITGAKFVNSDIDVRTFNGLASTLVDAPSKWAQFTGKIHVEYASEMNLPLSTVFQGTLSTLAGETNYVPLSTNSMQAALLAEAGATVSNSVGSVLLQNQGVYYSQTTAFTPAVTFDSAPSGGTTATGHVSSLIARNVDDKAIAGGTGYSNASGLAVKDAAGNTLPWTVSIFATSGALTDAYPTGNAISVGSGPYTVVQSGASGGTFAGTFAIASIAIDTAGAYPTGMPGVTIDGTHSAPGAAGVAVPSLLTLSAATRTLPVLTAALPACTSSDEGTIAAVTDANSVTAGAALTGGSGNHVPVYCNGTMWTVQ